MVDIEADDPVPGDSSMVCFGAVIVEPGLGNLRVNLGKVGPRGFGGQRLQAGGHSNVCEIAPDGLGTASNAMHSNPHRNALGWRGSVN